MPSFAYSIAPSSAHPGPSPVPLPSSNSKLLTRPLTSSVLPRSLISSRMIVVRHTGHAIQEDIPGLIRPKKINP